MGVMNRLVQSLHVALLAINQHRLMCCGLQRSSCGNHSCTAWCKKKKIFDNNLTFAVKLKLKSGYNATPDSPIHTPLHDLLQLCTVGLGQRGPRPRSGRIDSLFSNYILLQMYICWICFLLRNGSVEIKVSILWTLDFSIQQRRVREAEGLFPCQRSVCTNLVQGTLWMDIMQCCPPAEWKDTISGKLTPPTVYVYYCVNETD